MTEYTHTQIAQKIVDMKKGVEFIAIAIGMLSDISCDLDGRVSYYARDMQALKRKAIHSLKEEEDDG